MCSKFGKIVNFFFLFHIIFLIIFHKAIFPFQKFPIPPFMLLPSPSWCIPLQFYRFIDFIDLYLSHDQFWESPVPLAKYFNYFPVGFSFRKVTGLTHSFPMHPLSAPENIRKLYGGREGTEGALGTYLGPCQTHTFEHFCKTINC